MASGNFPSHAFTIPGAFVQLIPDIIAFTPNIILFQYNPEKVTRGISPWNPFEESTADDGTAAPDVAPAPPDETISFDLFLDATDPAMEYNPVNALTGVAGRIAALKKLVKPSKGMLGDLIQSASQLAGGNGDDNSQAERQTVPITFLVMGPGVMLPVRVSSLGFDQTLFNQALYPMHCKASVELQVLNPTMFRCKEHGDLEKLAIAAWDFNELQEDALALLNLANTGFDIAGLAMG